MRHTGPAADIYPSSPLGEQVDGIATGRDVDWEPLVDFRRNHVSETTIHGAVAWVHGKQLVHSFGGEVLCYGRSMMKPFMIRVFAEQLAQETSPEQRAIALSSHNGDAIHVSTAQSLLPEEDWGFMQAPLDTPLIQFGRQVRRPRRWFHTCSGEHAGILLGCKRRGWPMAGYMLPHHPFFAAYVAELRRFLGSDWTPLCVSRDGCGLPTLSNTVAELAQSFVGLAASRDDDWIWQAVTEHPDLIGGFNRLDSTILKSCAGKVLAKEGADGLLGLSIIHPNYPQGLGVVVKVAHGWNPQATWYVARSILGVLGFHLRNPYPLHRQKAFIVPGVVPDKYQSALEEIPTWDRWDPDQDRFYYDWRRFLKAPVQGAEAEEEKR
jgi:L-asparaginase